MNKPTTVPFTEKDVKAYLDGCIAIWRNKRDNLLTQAMAEYYIDAFQSVRISLFGELLPEEQSDAKN